jgi:hypothetical protein
MGTHTIPLEDITRLDVISVGGNLYLTGWNREEIRIKDLSDQDLVETKKKTVELQFPEDGVIHLPHHLEVRLKGVNGEAVIKDLGGELKVSAINGDLTINNIGAVSAESVNGDLIAKHIQGDLKVEKIGGDAIISDIKGQVGLKQIGGDLLIEKVAGGIEAQVGGDGTLDFSPVPWQAYQISVGGDLSVALPVDCNADLTLHSQARDIRILLDPIDISSRQEDLSQQLGEGGPSIMLSAGGKVFLSGDDYSIFSGFKSDGDKFLSLKLDFSGKTADHIKDSLGNLEGDLRESLAGLSESLEEIGLSEENLREFGLKIEETSRMAAEKAEFAAIKAQAKVEKNFAKARRKALKAKAKTKEFDLSKFLDRDADKKAVNEKERLLILEMLQEKKISLGEAEKLLQALEGKKS